jgi:Arc/MetJ-type ribon-helix-helix transcriptional regulator
VTLVAEAGANLSYGQSPTPGMIDSMTKAKIAVSLPPALVTRAQDAVREGRAPSISAYVTAALEEKAKLDDLKAMLDEMLANTGGPLTDRECLAADAALGVPTDRKHKRRRK